MLGNVRETAGAKPVGCLSAGSGDFDHLTEGPRDEELVTVVVAVANFVIECCTSDCESHILVFGDNSNHNLLGFKGLFLNYMFRKGYRKGSQMSSHLRAVV